MRESPSRTGDFLPRRLYVAEVIMLPLFWLAPLMALVVGGTALLDARSLRSEYGVHPSESPYLWVFATFMLSHLGSLGYRMSRRKAVRQHLGLTPSETAQLMEQLDSPRGYGVRGLFVLQITCVGAIFVIPDPSPAIAWTVVGLFVFTLVVGPFAVWLDQRQVREIDEVGWGWPRYLHLPVAVLPFGIFGYLVQRQQHVYYALFIRVWDADLSGVVVPEDEQSTLEKLADRLDDIGS